MSIYKPQKRFPCNQKLIISYDFQQESPLQKGSIIRFNVSFRYFLIVWLNMFLLAWRSTRSPRILPAHPAQCARSEGWLPSQVDMKHLVILVYIETWCKYSIELYCNIYYTFVYSDNSIPYLDVLRFLPFQQSKLRRTICVCGNHKTPGGRDCKPKLLQEWGISMIDPVPLPCR